MSALPRFHFLSGSNQRKFMDQLGANSLNIRKLEDWYNVGTKQVIKAGGASLLIHQYNGSLIKALQSIYPEYNWITWKFKGGQRGQWDDKVQRRQYLDWVAEELKITNPEDWYNVKAQDVKRLGGAAMLSKHGNSLIKALKDLYPEQNFLPWKFKHSYSGFWNDKENHYEYLHWLTKELSIKSPDDWYTVRQALIEEKGGSSLIKYYGSFHAALQTLLPASNFQFAARSPSPFGKAFWKNETNLHKYMDQLGKQLYIHKMEDWYQVSASELSLAGAYRALVAKGGLSVILPTVYPHIRWDISKLRATQTRPKAQQAWLTKVVRELFPGKQVFEDYHHPDLIFEGSKRAMQLDIYVPSIQLAFEFNGPQHYQEVYFMCTSLKTYEDRDKQKRMACASHNITLIEVPYWWDKKLSTLQGTIRQYRPDLVPAT